MYEEAPTWLSSIVIIIALIVLMIIGWIWIVEYPKQQAIIDKNEAYVKSLNLEETK